MASLERFDKFMLGMAILSCQIVASIGDVWLCLYIGKELQVLCHDYFKKAG